MKENKPVFLFRQIRPRTRITEKICFRSPRPILAHPIPSRLVRPRPTKPFLARPRLFHICLHSTSPHLTPIHRTPSPISIAMHHDTTPHNITPHYFITSPVQSSPDHHHTTPFLFLPGPLGKEGWPTIRHQPCCGVCEAANVDGGASCHVCHGYQLCASWYCATYV